MRALREQDAEWLASIRQRLRSAVALCVREDMPANMALLHLFLNAERADEVEDALELAYQHLVRQDAAAAQRLRRTLALWQTTPRAWELVKTVLEHVRHEKTHGTANQAMALWADAFDRAATVSPEAAVALYSLGSPALLAASTAETAELIRKLSLIEGHGVALEIGCGIGRLVERLSPHATRIIGLDISPVMLARARERCAGLDNVAFVLGSGCDLAAFRTASFDLVYAVDTFPYLVLSGSDLAWRHVQEAARVLRPGGSLVILNYSYRNDFDHDKAELARFAAQAGFQITRNGTRDNALWDGTTFCLQLLHEAAGKDSRCRVR